MSQIFDRSLKSTYLRGIQNLYYNLKKSPKYSIFPLPKIDAEIACVFMLFEKMLIFLLVFSFTIFFFKSVYCLHPGYNLRLINRNAFFLSDSSRFIFAEKESLLQQPRAPLVIKSDEFYDFIKKIYNVKVRPG